MWHIKADLRRSHHQKRPCVRRKRQYSVTHQPSSTNHQTLPVLMDDNSIRKFDAEIPAIEDLRQASGTPTLSLGVFHRGRIIYTKHFGCRDMAKNEPPDDDSIYQSASSAKIISICAVARLVHDGILDWDTPTRTYLPQFPRPDNEVGNLITLRDLACHRTGWLLANF
jgi:CubicO group peptidase (beta-lactamase class C family)